MAYDLDTGCSLAQNGQSLDALLAGREATRGIAAKLPLDSVGDTRKEAGPRSSSSVAAGTDSVVARAFAANCIPAPCSDQV